MQGEEVQEHEAGKERLKAERAREKFVRMGLIGSCLQPPDPSDCKPQRLLVQSMLWLATALARRLPGSVDSLDSRPCLSNTAEPGCLPFLGSFRRLGNADHAGGCEGIFGLTQANNR